jgi:hypothetical protein
LAELTELPESTELGVRAGLAELAVLAGLAELAAPSEPTGSLELAARPELTGPREPAELAGFPEPTGLCGDSSEPALELHVPVPSPTGPAADPLTATRPSPVLALRPQSS